MLSAVAVGALAAVMIPASVQAAPVLSPQVVSQGEGRLLTANLAGSPTDSLLALNGAQAVNYDASGDVVADVPLDATILGLPLTVPGNNLFGDTGIIQLGAVGQYAGANDDGSSVAFSGTVSQASSLVGSGTTVTGSNVGTPGASDSAAITVGTAQILGGVNLVGLSVGVGEVAASAHQPAGGGAATGDYTVNGLQIVVDGTVVSTAVGPINTLLAPVLTAVNALVDPDIVNPLAGGQLAITQADLLAEAGVADFDALPPGTDIMSFLPGAVTTKVTSLVNSLLTTLSTEITGLGLGGIAAGVLLGTAQPLVNTLVAGLAGTLEAPLGAAVTALLQMTVNNQSTTAGAFTQNALTIGIGPAGSLARVALANATVGPNAGPDGVIRIDDIDPNFGPVAGGTVVDITGTCFTGATGVTFDGLVGTAFTVIDDTHIQVTSPPHAVGAVDVVVQGSVACGGDETFPDGFTYVAATAPTITGMVPDNGPETGGTDVTITGVGFTGATGVTFDGISATNVVVVNSTTITATSPAHAPGIVGVVVQHPGGNSGPFDFTYTPVITVTSIVPNFGPDAGGTVVAITGTCFTGVTDVLFDGESAASFTVNSDTSITATTPAGTAGFVDVTIVGTVACGGNVVVPDGFQYIAANAPVILSLNPDSGPFTGGTAVIVTGSGFTGATGVTFDGLAALDFVVVNDTTITLSTPPHAVGAVNVVVQHPNGPSAPLGFTYLPATTVTGVTPGTGPEAGGTAVTITGTCFTGATGVLFGTKAATSFAVVDDTTITSVSPSGVGTVDVTVIGSLACGNGTQDDAFRYLPVLAFTGALLLPPLLGGLGLLLVGLVLIVTRRLEHRTA
jgi:hypothetical protein